MFKTWKAAFILTIAVCLSLAGCSSKSADNSAGNTASNTASNNADSGGKTDSKVQTPAISDAPVTLTFYIHVEAFDETSFNKYIADLVKKKHPNITLEYLGAGGRDKIAELIASGTVPDLIFSGTDNFYGLKNVAVDGDMTDLLKKYNFDLSVFDPSTIQSIRGVDDGKLPAIPFSRNGAAMFYNKEIFDKFAVPYPVNDMTWDQTIDLARRVTRLQDGVQYIGWEPGFPDANAEVFSKPLVDIKTKKALVDTPEYQKVFAMMMKGWEIPGFGGDKNVTRYTPANFVKDKYVGIFVDWYNKFFLQLDPATEAGTAPDWDLVTVPNFPENMGKARHSSVQFLMIPQQSKHKDQALQVIQTVSSLDAQLLQGRSGRIPVLADPEIQKQFGKDTKTLANKHVENLFKNKTVADAPATIYDDAIIKILRDVATSLAKNKEDVNTALRNAQAEADKKVAEMDAQ